MRDEVDGLSELFNEQGAMLGVEGVTHYLGDIHRASGRRRASEIATQLHQYFRPNTPPVSSFGPLLVLQLPDLLVPLGVAIVLGGVGGMLGERLLPSRGADRPA